MNAEACTWADRAEALAFLGNSLLAPISQTSTVGLEPAFWDSFPDFGNQQVRSALDRCAEFARLAKKGESAGANVAQDVSVEYTQLFIGPPKPAAPPWESFYRASDVISGFGAATFEMQKLLREIGLEISNDNNQYADHVGIELLYLSALCGKTQEGDDATGQLCRQFAQDRLLSWISLLHERVEAAAPRGYYVRIINLVEAILSEALQ